MTEAHRKKGCYEFERGYICALSCIVAGHGTDTAVREALHALGPVDWRRIDGHDRAILAETMQEVERTRERNKP